MKCRKFLFFIFILLPLNGWGFEYVLQKEELNSDQLKFLSSIKKRLHFKQFIDVSENSSRLIPHFNVHRIFVSQIDQKTVGAVFLDNSHRVDYPDRLTVGDSEVLHIKWRSSVLAVWLDGFLKEEVDQIHLALRKNVASIGESLMSHFFPSAQAEVCEPSGNDLGSVAGKLNESSYGLCWSKLSEGMSSYAESVAESAKQAMSLNFGMAEYWQKFKTLVRGVGDFARSFFTNPWDWVQSHVPNFDSLDLSGLKELQPQQVLGLACLALGREGPSSAVSSLVRGPAGLGMKLFEMFKKFSAVSKTLEILKKLGNLAAENWAFFKDKVVKLSEKIIKGEKTPTDAEALNGLLNMSPALAKEGLACMGI